MSGYQIVDTHEESYLYAECECAMRPEAISQAMGKAYEDVMGFIQAHGMALTGPALSVYHSYDPETVRFRAGFFVSAEDASKAEGKIKAGMTPVGRAVHFFHTGPYTRLGESYDAMTGWLGEQGLELGSPIWEVYVDDPDTVPQERLRTAIYAMLADTGEAAKPEKPKILVTYYSRTGHTEKLAKALAEKLGADLDPIREARSRTGFWQYMRSGREALRGDLAEIEPARHDPADYDVVVLGSPVWASHPSTPVNAYLAAHKAKLNALACFVTLGGSGAEKTLERMEAGAGKPALARFSATERELKSGAWQDGLDRFAAEIGKVAKS